ncbi:isopentenyl-diphosphate Delta-isomerase [Humibacter ginsengisoli]
MTIVDGQHAEPVDSGTSTGRLDLVSVDPARVVLLDDHGNPTGTAEKVSVHGADTPLHLGFSCHVLLDDGRVLVTRRALSKLTFPGVWTNAFCGHPAPDESVPDAVSRHARDELGIRLADLELVLPDFRYRAVDAGGVVEYEICPVYVARAVGEPVLNPAEVAEVAAVRPAELGAALRSTPWAFSAWLVEQANLMPLYA